MRDTSHISERYQGAAARHFRLQIVDWPKDRHRMISLVETMMTADGLRLTAYGPDEDVARIVEDLPKAKTPHVWANG